LEKGQRAVRVQVLQNKGYTKEWHSYAQIEASISLLVHCDAPVNLHKEEFFSEGNTATTGT
jgi:hypothetical protein